MALGAKKESCSGTDDCGLLLVSHLILLSMLYICYHITALIPRSPHFRMCVATTSQRWAPHVSLDSVTTSFYQSAIPKRAAILRRSILIGHHAWIHMFLTHQLHTKSAQFDFIPPAKFQYPIFMTGAMRSIWDCVVSTLLGYAQSLE